MKYCEYFEIDKNYYPVINPDSIKNQSLKWQDTFPHETFISLLETTEKILARETGDFKKCLWVEGAYGTGKSRVLWALQNILSCADKELDAYFAEYKQLRAKQDLKNKIEAHKKQGIIIAQRYESGTITTPERFISAVYDSVAQALRRAGLNYIGKDTLRGSMLKWFEDAKHKRFFEEIIKSPENQAKSGINGKNTDSIIEQLKNMAEPDYLLESIMQIAEKEGINAFKFSIYDLKQWLTDVIKTNNLHAIVFFWDEFSDYFKNNKNSLGTFQSLAELSNNVPFYMAIATHMGAAAYQDQSFKLVRDRFIIKTIEMPDNIAFKLINHAMKIKPEAEKQYKELTDELNSNMYDARHKVCAQASTSDEDMQGLFPIHPMAALVLKNIAVNFASNQRSMFNFIKNDDSDNLQAFQWFINNHDPINGDILTIDLLWNFFYEKGTDGNTSLIGKSNLDSRIAIILGAFSNNEHKLNNEEEKRVLKTLLMMEALSKKLNGSVELLRPTKENLKLAFNGVDSLDNNRAINIAESLVDKKILYKDSSSKGEEYAAAAVAGDQEQINRIKENCLQIKTGKIIQQSGLDDAGTELSMPAAIKLRYLFKSVGKDNFEQQAALLANENSKIYRIKALVCFAKNEDEQREIRQKIHIKLQDNRYKDIVFIDASHTPLGNDDFEKYAEYCAQEEYWRNKDDKQAANKRNDYMDLLNEWKKNICQGNFTVYAYNEEINLCGTEQLKRKLQEITSRKFPWSFDHISISDSFFSMSNLPQGAKNGINKASGGIYQKKDLEKVFCGILNLDKYWEKDKNNPISKIKIEIKKMADADLEGSPFRISISKIFDELMEQGFMPCNLYAYITGFLLKEYSLSQYRYAIGETGEDGGRMEADILGNYIGEYIRHINTNIRNYKEKYIAKMTKEQQAFASFASEVFDIHENSSVERIVSKFNEKMQSLRCPVWCFEYAADTNLGYFIKKLAEISNLKTGNVAVIAGEIGKDLIDSPQAVGELKPLFTKEKGNEALHNYLSQFENGALLAAAEQAGIKEQDAVNAAREKTTTGAASWLWDKDTADEQLKTLITEYKIIAASNDYGINAKNFAECLKRWNEYIKFHAKLPYSLLKENLKELSYFLDCIKHYMEEYEILTDKQEKFLHELESKKTEIASLESRSKEILKKEYSNYLSDLDEEDINSLYAKLDGHSFLKDIGTYEIQVSSISNEIKKAKAYYRLLSKWKELTGTENVEDWQDTYKMPIKAIILPSESKENRERAYSLFEAVKYGTDSQNAEIMLKYLSSKPFFVDALNNETKREEAFCISVIKDYSSIITNDEARAFLEKTIGSNYDNWYGSQADEELKKLARQKYHSGDGKKKLHDKINAMPAEEAKKYLISIIDNNFDAGISILKGE